MRRRRNFALTSGSRTNSIRNNTMQGAAAGTPGTLPTNWVLGTVAGLSTQVVGIGTESAINYIDFRIFGTSNNTVLALFTDGSGIAAAATGQIWFPSAFIKAAPSSAGTGSVTITYVIREYTSGGGTVQDDPTSAVTVNSSASALGQSRQGPTGITLSGGATTAFVSQRFAFTFSNSATIDQTYRIGWPQLEMGSFASTPIPTAGSAVTLWLPA